MGRNRPYSLRLARMLCKSFRTGYSHPSGAIVPPHDAAPPTIDRHEALRPRWPVHLAFEVWTLRTRARGEPRDVCAHRGLGGTACNDPRAVAMFPVQRAPIHGVREQPDEARPVSQFNASGVIVRNRPTAAVLAFLCNGRKPPSVRKVISTARKFLKARAIQDANTSLSLVRRALGSNVVDCVRLLPFE